jgi:hypothetical protein
VNVGLAAELVLELPYHFGRNVVFGLPGVLGLLDDVLVAGRSGTARSSGVGGLGGRWGDILDTGDTVAFACRFDPGQLGTYDAFGFSEALSDSTYGGHALLNK